MSLLSTFAFLAAVYALKRWLSKLWHNTGALIIYGTGNLPSSRLGHTVLFILALFRTIFRVVVGIIASVCAASLVFEGTRNLFLLLRIYLGEYLKRPPRGQIQKALPTILPPN